jgi:hypothetical protein
MVEPEEGEAGWSNQKVRGWTVEPEDQRWEDLGLNEDENNEVE